MPKDPVDDIYTICIPDAPYLLKKLELLWGQKKVKIIIDNKHYEPLIVEPEEVIINSSIIWFCREIER